MASLTAILPGLAHESLLQASHEQIDSSERALADCCRQSSDFHLHAQAWKRENYDLHRQWFRRAAQIHRA